MKYADSTAAIFEYVGRHCPSVDAWWVISRESPDIDLARRNGSVAIMEDADTYRLALAARVMVISHGVHDVPGCSSRFAKGLKVRTGHGITALVKRALPSKIKRNDLSALFDMIPVSSEFEADNKREWGFGDAQLSVTGVARFDRLHRLDRTSESARKKILYMPTARDKLVGRDDKMDGSVYLKYVVALLTNERLVESVTGWGGEIAMYVHPLMWGHVEAIRKSVSSDVVRVLEPNADLQIELANSSLLITDYSSVAWDALYINRPVVFYQFDREEYYQGRGGGSHVCHEELFGPCVKDSDEVARYVDDYISSGFGHLEFETLAAHWRERAFVEIDESNCQRVVEEIVRRLSGSVAHEGRA